MSQTFKHIQDLIDYEKLMILLGLEDYTEDKEELWLPCPLPFGNHQNGDRTPSFSINISDTEKKGLYSCFVCGGGNFVQLVASMKNISYTEAEQWVIENTNQEQSDSEFKERIQRLLDSKKPKPKEKKRQYSFKMLEHLKPNHPWFAEQGFSQEAIDHFGLVYDPDRDGIILPHTHQGKLVGWQVRLLSDSKKKYVNTSGFPKRNTLFNLDIVSRDYDHVIVVEGPKSVIKLWSLGVKNVVATFGAEVTQEQILSLLSFNKVSLWFDNDRAGVSATRNTISFLKGLVDIYLIPPVEGEKGDPGDLSTKAEVDSYLEKSQSLLKFELGG